LRISDPASKIYEGIIYCGLYALITNFILDMIYLHQLLWPWRIRRGRRGWLEGNYDV
jgi:hypothetical protein